MTIEDALYDFLQSRPGVRALCADRIWEGERPPRGGLPAIVFSIVGQTPTHNQAGPSTAESVRVQIDCIAQTKAAARQVREAAKDALNGYMGAMGGRGQTVTCLRAFLEGGAMTVERTGDGSSSSYWIATQDYEIHYRDS